MSQISHQQVNRGIPAGLEISIHQPSAHRTEFSKAAEAFWERDYPAARAILNPILRDDPDNDSALRLLAKASEDNNPAPSLRANASRLIDSFHASGDKDLLQKAFKLAYISQAYDIRQQEDALHHIFARIALAEDDKEKAAHHLEVALTHNPRHKKSKQLLKSINPPAPEATKPIQLPPVHFGATPPAENRTQQPPQTWADVVAHLNGLS